MRCKPEVTNTQRDCHMGVCVVVKAQKTWELRGASMPFRIPWIMQEPHPGADGRLPLHHEDRIIQTVNKSR